MKRTLDPDSPAVHPRCGSCGRLLRSQASRVLGLGPRCARAACGRTGPLVAASGVAVRIPGQTELPLYDHQPTLWSL